MGAELTGAPPAQSFKTLVMQGKSRQYYVFVIPIAEEADLKAAAKAVGEKSAEMIPVKDITAVTGYVCGGRIRTAVVLNPNDLLSVIHGTYADLVQAH